MDLYKDIQVYWIHSSNQLKSFKYILKKLNNTSYDRITYKNAHWSGISSDYFPNPIAWFNSPEDSDITPLLLYYLIDDKYHILQTANGNHFNTYSIIYITSSIDFYSFFKKCSLDLFQELYSKKRHFW